ncbi:UDP-N-acetylmuramoyl-L-alanine--D-glutamate ligase [Geobacter hydrogenophilus]|uniref:UDP-N-acetylmuramoylalanine--D-glutamate ligase n=1 Tax=Geobacter hydrogenophilus TaxID=40983 RepID=A0A9W6G0B6_9BACT|nr:UDP-N-acetylmuramoyl-L-alanine--D-glutamate ligase [Geobacter hydrogenophilus]MBT0894264.1 UDP-N-acetylmuramoyl-L-alanine--D-glutamate ligase [Geobacter hydrogenophilus]GLI38450.1 UDP-N-acetylmuramoylalanine--D-glutamate ligase [Geobacter hydrogenophilus]
MDISGKNILVVGLARTGVAVARFLVRNGARVTVTDLRDESALAGPLGELAGLPVRYVLGHHDETDFAAADVVVVSPGVPQESPYLQAARRAGREVITEIELASRFVTAPVVAITGTNGKTTTTTLTGEIFSACGFRTFVGGNIGNPLIELIEGGEAVERVVVEISSFQLEWISSFRPRVAVLLNITEDHLDRYATFLEYIDAKVRIFENQQSSDFAVLNVDDPIVAGIAGRVAATVFPMSQQRELAEGIFHRDGVITFRHGGREECFPTARFRITGVHNIENIMASLAATLLLGCDAIQALAAVEGFGGLPHRMELVRELAGVRYYEDSKATNVGSVEKALASFNDITLIAGGKDKGGSYAPLAPLVTERVRHMVLIGEAKERMARELGGLTDTRMATTLEEAVELAARLTESGGVVLFSPACSSFDMFRDYEERAQRFRAAVNALGTGERP